MKKMFLKRQVWAYFRDIKNIDWTGSECFIID